MFHEPHHRVANTNQRFVHAITNADELRTRRIETSDKRADLREVVVHDSSSAHRQLASDQVHGLNAVRSFVNRGDARIAEMLWNTGLFDVAHTAIDLNGQRRNFDAHIGAETL
ncbi:unannotated protein [freshwater metagenome]|uniref:Unannotated protein n=1 Tax=freshwater metagenome TaxID=449393 RepID=A0A6J7P008_9ZZZZ